jgi:molecular chaperone GrpE
MADQTYKDGKSSSALRTPDDDPASGRAGDETAAEQAESSGDGSPADQPDAALKTLQSEKDALQDRLLRNAAEFDNYRKRVERERRELSEFAAADVLQDLLPIVDNFERALQAPAGTDLEAFRKGIELIHRQMLDVLKKRGLTAIDSVGADFDPNVHQAVIHEASDEHREGEVMQELQRGYKIGDRLLRPAMVKVAKRQ